MLNSIAIIYTMLGGMKAVIMTDVLQSVVMLSSMVILVVFAYAEIGTSSVFAISAAANGHQMADLSFDMTRRTSAWGYMIFEFCFIGFRVTFGQYFVQRVVACKSAKDGNKSFMIGCGFAWVLGVVLVPMLGVAALAYFHHCDPLEAGIVGKKDEVVPLLTTQVHLEMSRSHV